MRFFIFAFLLCLSPPVFGYQVGSSFGDPCHESISLRAFLNSAVDLTPPAPFEFPDNEIWKKLSDSLLEQNGLVIESDIQRFIIVSLLIGNRSPDTDGHALLDLDTIRALHLAEEGQYLHALRAADDDGEEGNAAAIKGMRAEIRSSLNEAGRLLKDPIIEVEVSLEFYGAVSLELSGPAYFLGRAMHTLQDSFSHTIRSENTRRIYHVMNYVEAVRAELEESRDGMAHSDSMDACTGKTAPLYNAAREATIHLLTVVTQEKGSKILERDIDNLLDYWLTYEKGCTLENDYCSSKWVELAREKPTGPYLKTIVSCSTNRTYLSLWPLFLIVGMTLPRRLS